MIPFDFISFWVIFCNAVSSLVHYSLWNPIWKVSKIQKYYKIWTRNISEKKNQRKSNHSKFMKVLKFDLVQIKSQFPNRQTVFFSQKTITKINNTKPFAIHLIFSCVQLIVWLMQWSNKKLNIHNSWHKALQHYNDGKELTFTRQRTPT